MGGRKVIIEFRKFPLPWEKEIGFLPDGLEEEEKRLDNEKRGSSFFICTTDEWEVFLYKLV